MKSLAEHLMSPDFWIFGVILAIILSVLGNYATRFVDKGFRLGSERVRMISSRNRERHAAKIAHINNWITDHENGAMLVLSEAHFLCFLGMSIVTLVIATLLFARAEIAASSTLLHLALFLASALASILALAAMNRGGMLLNAVRNHKKGLEGLHQTGVKPPK